MSMQDIYSVKVPIADLWSKPTKERYDHTVPGSSTHPRSSQLIYEDSVKVLKEENDFFYVETSQIKPPSFYQGYVNKAALQKRDLSCICCNVVNVPWFNGLPYGSLTTAPAFPPFGTHRGSKALYSEAALFLGTPYLWGGTSMPDRTGTFVGGVDCSGLVYLVYRTALGILLPRDAHDQYNACIEIDDQVSCGDLAFWKHKQTGRVSHVAIYIGNKKAIHAPETGEHVCYLDLDPKRPIAKDPSEHIVFKRPQALQDIIFS